MILKVKQPEKVIVIIFDKGVTKLKNIFSKYSIIIAASLSYIILFVILITTAQGILTFNLFPDYAIRGVIAQIQSIVLILLVLTSDKKAFRTAIILNSFSLLQVSLAIKFNNSPDLIPGIFSYLTSFVAIFVINHYQGEINSKLKELKNDKEEIKRIAFEDNLTKIANRKKIIERLDLLAEQKEENNLFELIFIDFKNFKNINDSYGHFAGDFILKECSSRLAKIVNPKDFIGRLGGDEFAVIVERKLSKKEAKKYIQKIKLYLEKPYNYNDHNIILDINFGISYFPNDADNSHDLIRSSDIAMYKAKANSNKSIEFYSEDMEKDIITNMKLEEALKKALANDEFNLVFQPQYYANSEEIRGFETLLRWNSAKFGQVSPAKFIPITEKTGLIREVGHWVIKNAVDQFNELAKLLADKIVLSVNISVIQIMQPNFVEQIKGILENKNDNFNLEFEITESVFISDQSYVVEILYKLKEMGIKIALDDFGTGYASLSYLQNIPLDIIKIDKIFIDTINSKTENEINVVAPIINLAHQWGMGVVAEGVETTEQLHYLKNYDCDYIQGYLFNKPLKTAEIETIFKDKLVSSKI